MKKTYLGDSIFAEVDFGNASQNVVVILTVEKGVDVVNKIILEREVLIALEQYLAKVRMI